MTMHLTPRRGLESLLRLVDEAEELGQGDEVAFLRPWLLADEAKQLTAENRHSEALAAARRSVALNPNSAYGNFRLAQVLVYAGAPAEALKPIQRSLRYSPFDAQMGAMLGTLALVHYQSRDYHQSAQQARAAIDNGFAAAHVLLAASLARLGRLDEARLALAPDMLTRVLKETIRMATYVNPADRDHLVQGLELVIRATAE
jgi:predicted Zn-dependent protease